MKFLDYIGKTSEQFEEYINRRLVLRAKHNEFPLEIYTYGRAAVHDNVWDEVTTKCRGIIVNSDTGEIVARPFEKFFNLGTEGQVETQPENLPTRAPVVYEKVDGFLCTAYTYNGQDYIASKGSFNSIHAKWATAEYNAHSHIWPEGYTPVFEGITPNLRIVVDYKGFEGLVLLALINNETGEELSPSELTAWAVTNNFATADIFDMNWLEATKKALNPESNIEGYVLTWYKVNQPPLRVKVKYIEYLRLHRMVTGVSPKHIFEILSENMWSVYAEEYVQNSTPWFKEWALKWKNALESKFNIVKMISVARFVEIRNMMTGYISTRKEWALEIMKTPELSSILFAMLDNKSEEELNGIIWKKVKPMIKNSHPMVDAFHV